MQQKARSRTVELRTAAEPAAGGGRRPDGEAAAALSELVGSVPPRMDRPVIGRLTAWGSGGRCEVDFPDNPGGRSVAARSVVCLEAGAVGREVVLTFAEADPRRPIISGLLEPTSDAGPEVETASVKCDGDRLVFTAGREVVLRCGAASITLTRAGKVLIRGTYVLSRSSGVNRVKGGSVQIN